MRCGLVLFAWWLSCFREPGLWGVGSSEKIADLALELAQDGALLMQLAGEFGEITYMTGV